MAKLTDIDVEEISLVDAPANLRKFVIIKELGTMNKDLEGLIKVILGDSFKKSENHDQAMIDAFKVIEKYIESLPDEVKKALQTISFQLTEDDSVIAKFKTEIEALHKAGREISAANLKRIKEAIATLNDLLPDEEKVLKSAEKTPEEKIMQGLADITARIEKLEKPEQPKQEPETDIVKILNDISKRLQVVESAKGLQKGQSQGTEDPPKEDEDLWPSLKL